MTTSDDNSTQARVIFMDEDRPAIIRDILAHDDFAERRESLAEVLIQLREHLGQQGEGWPQVSRELHLLLEETFKGSETYDLALELYQLRHSLVGGNPAEVLRMVMDEQLSPPPRGVRGGPVAVPPAAGLRFTPEQYQKRLEVARAAILGTDIRRIDGMHGCLLVDDERLARILTLLEET
jgi:hypothetical protein